MKVFAKIFKNIMSLALALSLSAAGLSGCARVQTENLTDEPLSFSTEYLLGGALNEAFYPSENYSNGGGFNVVWSAENLSFTEDATVLFQSQRGGVIYSGEIRSKKSYSYGDYQVTMKPSAVSGTASTFFLYTGEYEGNPHDEIDIEFLGKDTTKVQFNYFVGGKGGHEYLYDLGFDASKDYHDYGFRWTKDYIVWFVDGKPVYKVFSSGAGALPSSPSRIFMNYWSGTSAMNGWMGRYDGAAENDQTLYKCVKISAALI